MSSSQSPEHLDAFRPISGGRASKTEIQFLRAIQSFIDDAIRDGLGFASVVEALREDVNLIAQYRYDIDAPFHAKALAVLKGGQVRGASVPPPRNGPPLSEKEVAFLRDIQGFIDYAIRNDLGLRLVVTTLGHDVNGIARYGFNLDEALGEFFAPKVEGFAGSHEDDVGAVEESDE